MSNYFKFKTNRLTNVNESTRNLLHSRVINDIALSAEGKVSLKTTNIQYGTGDPLNRTSFDMEELPTAFHTADSDLQDIADAVGINLNGDDNN